MTSLTHFFSRHLIALAAVASLVLAPVAFAQDDRDERKSTSQKGAKSALEINISNGNGVRIHVNNDSVDVRGATVTAVSGNTITATTLWGNATITWKIVMDSSTKFTNKGDRNAPIADLKVGDTLNFSGKADIAASNLAGLSFSVKAKAIKDLSVNTVLPSRHIFEGKLQAVTDSTLPGSLSLMVGSKLYTVLVPTDTFILNALWGTTTLDRFSAGDTVRVLGSLQAGSDSIIDAFIVRDASLR